MPVKSYLRPIGIVSAPGLRDDESFFGGLPLTGDGSLFYTCVEIFERSEGGNVKRSMVSLGELWEKNFGLDGGAVSEVLQRLSDPRSRIAGLGFDAPILMGIVNVTPDSFSDGGEFFDARAAIDHALRLEDEGAAILDIGGESTRPDADPVSLDEELRRVLPVLDGLAGRVEARLSIDSRKSEVMRQAAQAGADILNDVSALTHDAESLEVASATGLSIILMHARGTPQTMQDEPVYGNVLLDIYDYLEERINACVDAGIARSRLIVDPGLGFGKTVSDNLTLIRGMGLFHGLGVPVLMGASRKRFIGAITGEDDARARMPASLAAAMIAVSQGVQIVRVHDVAETRQAFALWQAIAENAGD